MGLKFKTTTANNVSRLVVSILVVYLEHCTVDPGDKDMRVPCYPWNHTI